MGEHFSGSCTVTSRNPLIHNGATTATKSERFDPKGVHQGLLSRACHCVEEPLATVNFGEFLFLGASVNTSKRKGRGVMLRPLRPRNRTPHRRGANGAPYIPFVRRSWPLMAPSGYWVLWTLT